jgi:hypothetical protein
VIPTESSALSAERSTVAKTKAGTEKLKTEAAKILQETRWYPVAAFGAIGVALLGSLATIIVAAVKVLQHSV